MKLRSVILLGVLGVLVTLVGSTVVVVSLRLEGVARQQIVTDLERSCAVFADLQALRASLYRWETLTIAEEPRLKAVLGTSDIDRATIVDVAVDMHRAGNADLFLLLDESGRLVVDIAEPAGFGQDLTDHAIVRAALLDGEAEGVWTRARQVLEVHARRLDIGDEVVGVLVLGRRTDEVLARTIARHTGSDVVLTLDGAIVNHAVDTPGLPEALVSTAGGLGELVEERVLFGERYLLRALPVPGYAGERTLRWVFIESLDAALATVRALRLWIYGLAALALLVASGLAWILARQISRPVDRLVEFTRNIATGRLDARAALRGPVEVRVLAAAMNQMASELTVSRGHLGAMERLERELEIARRIQTSILPRERSAPGFEIDARMLPASEVGGDYYDILPVADGCWLGVGDVAGHGLTAGLVMLMIQSLVAVLVHEHPDARPSVLIPALNSVLYKNIRDRMAQDEHVTFTLLRVFVDGRVQMAGAHEDIIVCRAADGSCESIAPPGTWLGVVPEVSPGMPEAELLLHPGDLMLLYTDGVTEAKDRDRRQYGMDRLIAALAAVRERSAAQICDHLMGEVAAWTEIQDDDVTVLVLRYLGPPGPRR